MARYNDCGVRDMKSRTPPVGYWNMAASVSLL